MKKRVLIGIAVVFISGLIGYGYLAYRQKQSYRQYIPANASALFRINVDALLQSIVWNAVSNPLYYFGSDQEKPKKPFEINGLGLHIPANVFFFSMEPYDATLFSVFRIDDFEKFEHYIKHGLNIKSVNTMDSLTFQGNTADEKLCLLYSKEYLALSISASKVATTTILRSLVLQNNMIAVERSHLLDAIKANHELVYTNGTNTVIADFGPGTLSLKGQVKTNMIRGAEHIHPRRFTRNSLVKGWLAADVGPLLTRQQKFFEKHRIPVDTLLHYYGGYVDLEWKKNLILQQDTVITYDYNENFEKVEQKSIRKERIPEIYLSFQASPHLANYLPKQLFYKFGHKSQGDRLLFGTGENYQQNSLDGLSSNFFYFYIDIKGLKKQGNYPLLQQYSKQVEKIELKSQKLASQYMAVYGKLNFENKSIHGLMQLLRSVPN